MILFLFFLFQMTFQHQIDILRQRAAIVFRFVLDLCENITVNCDADFFF